MSCKSQTHFQITTLVPEAFFFFFAVFCHLLLLRDFQYRFTTYILSSRANKTKGKWKLNVQQQQNKEKKRKENRSGARVN